MKKILITGGSGFIGSRLVSFLEKTNHSIVLLSRLPRSNSKTFICDFMTDQIPKDAFIGVDTVFHLAGLAHDTKEKEKMSNFYEKLNVDSTVQLAKLAIENKVKKFIFVSSVKAGGKSIHGSYSNENDQVEPEEIYGKTKRDAELKLLQMSLRSNMHISIIRPSLVYGPNVKGNLKLMIQGISQGWFPPLPKINNKKTMVHVDDLVRALLFVSQEDLANGEIFNITDGKTYSTREIYESVCFSLNKSVPNWTTPKIIFDFLSILSPSFKNKINKLLGDEFHSSKKIESLGFKPNLTIKDMNETLF